MNLSKLQSEAVKLFSDKYQEVIGDLIDSAIDIGSKTDNNPLVIDLSPIRQLTPEFIEARTKLEQFLSDQIQKAYSKGREEIEPFKTFLLNEGYSEEAIDLIGYKPKL